MESDVLGNIAAIGTTVGMFLIFFIVILIVGFAGYMYVTKVLAYKMKVRYFYSDAQGNTKMGTDKGGIFARYKIIKFWLKKHKVGLDVDKVKFIEIGNQKIAYFVKKGQKSFRPVEFAVDTDKIEMKLGEEDVNWGITQIQMEAKRFDWKSFLSEYGAMIMWIVFGMFILIAIIVILNKFEVLQSVAEELHLATIELAKNNLGAQVLE